MWTKFATLAWRKPLGALSAVILCGVVGVAILAGVIAPCDPYQFNLDHRGLPVRLQAPNATFLLGTDALGRDVLSRLVYGARVSLLVGFASVLVGTLLGTVLGLASGYCEGRVDSVLQRGVDTVMAVPGIERHQIAVYGAHEKRIAEYRQTPVNASAAKARRLGRIVDMRPEDSAGCRVHGHL